MSEQGVLGQGQGCLCVGHEHRGQCQKHPPAKTTHSLTRGQQSPLLHTEISDQMHSSLPAKLEGKFQFVTRIAPTCKILPALFSPLHPISQPCIQPTFHHPRGAVHRTPPVQVLNRGSLFAIHLHLEVREHPGTAVNRVCRGTQIAPLAPIAVL